MSIPASARRLASLLRERNCKIVFAESCTGGLTAGALTQIPGISQHLCGGMITYRNETKQAYLKIPAKTLQHPGAVSDVVAQQMAKAILNLTPEADVAISVTGHLGPHAPAQLDGVVFIGIAIRSGKRRSTAVQRFEYPATLNRTQRQRRAIEDALGTAADFLETRD